MVGNMCKRKNIVQKWEREIRGPAMENGVWKIRKINELLRPYGILSGIKLARIVPRSPTSLTKKIMSKSIFQDRLGGRKPKRSPKKMLL